MSGGVIARPFQKQSWSVKGFNWSKIAIRVTDLATHSNPNVGTASKEL